MAAPAKPTKLPPDDELRRLAALVNAKLRPTCGVSFYRLQHADQSIETGIVFECGPRRALVQTRDILTEHSADEIVASVQRWANRVRPWDKWTLNPEEAT